MTNKNEDKSFLILTIINQQGSRGTTTKDLTEKTGIDRWTIADICTKLRLDKYIKSGKRGKSNIYFPTQKVLEYNLFIESLLLKKKILSNYFSSDLMLDGDKLSENNIGQEKYISNSKFDIPNVQETSILDITGIDEVKKYENYESISLKKLPLYLQNFVLNIGMFVTFVFFISSSPNLKKTISEEIGTNNEDLINEQILNWLSRVITPKDLYHDFRQMFLRLGIKDFEHKSLKNNIQNFTFDSSESLFELVTDTLKYLYPDHFKKLNDIYLNLKKNYQEEKRYAFQNTCSHKYETDKNMDLEIIIFNCQICKKQLLYKRSDIWRVDQIKEELKYIQTQTKNKSKYKKSDSEIPKIHGNCNCFDGKHLLFIRKSYREDILNGEPVEKIFQCLFCNNNWSFIIGKKIMEKVSEEIESIVGVDIYSKILSNSIFKFIFYNKNLSINFDEVTLKRLAFFGLYPKYREHIQEFDKDKRNILKILLKYEFINHIYTKNHLISNNLDAYPFYQTYQWSTDMLPFEVKI
jgi:hypothetical protein